MYRRRIQVLSGGRWHSILQAILWKNGPLEWCVHCFLAVNINFLRWRSPMFSFAGGNGNCEPFLLRDNTISRLLLFSHFSSAWNNNACAAASLSPPTVTFMEDESGNFAENIFYFCHEPKAYLENNFIFVLCAANFVRSLAPREIFNYYYLTYFRTVNMIYFMQGKPFVSNVWMDAVDLYRYHVQS